MCGNPGAVRNWHRGKAVRRCWGGGAASLAYVRMSLSCFKCHKHIREVRMVRAD